MLDIAPFALFFGGFALGIASIAVFNWLVQRTARSVLNTRAGIKGREANAKYESRMQEAIVEAVALYKAGTAPMDIGKQLIGKYPDVALKLGKKLAEGGFNLQSLLGGIE